jgi:mannose-6-phosphate isomerase-like protein (cupin superfamily)
MAEYRYDREEAQEYRSPGGSGRYARVLFDNSTIPGAKCSLGVFRYDPGGVGPAHEHDAEVEVYFGLQGEGVVEFLGKAHSFGPGVAVYVPPKTVHQTRNVGEGVLEFATFFAPAISLAFVKEWEEVES